MEVLGSEIEVGQSIFAPPYGWIKVTAVDCHWDGTSSRRFVRLRGVSDSSGDDVHHICRPSSRFTVAEQHATASTNADEFCTHDRSPGDWDGLLGILATTKSEIKEKKTGGGPPARPPAEAHDDPWG
jgi:hypothetical protein